MSKAVLSTLLVAALLTGCGGGKNGSSTKPKPASDDAAVRAAMQRWVQADTPAKVCGEIASGFKIFLSGGNQAACAKRATKKLRDFAPKAGDSVKITKVTHLGPQRLVHAMVLGKDGKSVRASSVWYFRREDGAWKLNSIGQTAPAGPGNGPATP